MSTARSERDAVRFAALGDPTRLRLVKRLARHQALSITQLSAGTKITRQAVTKHLQVLAGAGIASAERMGREQLWSLDRRQLAEARAILDEISRSWDDALARLKSAVEEDV